jgi:hypothetical protein
MPALLGLATKDIRCAGSGAGRLGLCQPRRGGPRGGKCAWWTSTAVCQLLAGP